MSEDRTARAMELPTETEDEAIRGTYLTRVHYTTCEDVLYFAAGQSYLPVAELEATP